MSADTGCLGVFRFPTTLVGLLGLVQARGPGPTEAEVWVGHPEGVLSGWKGSDPVCEALPCRESSSSSPAIWRSSRAGSCMLADLFKTPCLPVLKDGGYVLSVPSSLVQCMESGVGVPFVPESLSLLLFSLPFSLSSVVQKLFAEPSVLPQEALLCEQA